MFGKLRPTRSAATSPTPQLQLGPTPQSAPKRPSLLVKKLIRIKNVFSRPSSANKGDHSQGNSQRQQAVPAPSQSSQGLNGLTHDDQGRFDRRRYRASGAEPIRSALSPCFHSGSQGSTLRTAPRSATSANNSPLLAPTTFSSQCLTSHNAPRPTYSSNSQRRPVVTRRATTFAPARSTQPTPRPIFPIDSPPLMALAHSVVTNPATDSSALSASFLCSTPKSGLFSASPMIAELEQTAANLDHQYNECIESVRATMEDHIFPYTQSMANESKLAKNRLEELKKQLAAVDQACSQLEEQCKDECKKLGQVEAALKKAHCDVQEIDKKHTALQVELREMQLGQDAYQGWQKLYGDALQRDAQRVEEEQNGSSTSPKSFQQVKKAMTSWNSQWDSMIARHRYSEPRAVQAAAKSEAQRSGDGRDGRPTIPNPSRWMNQVGSAGVNKKGPAARTPQVGTATAPTEPRQHAQDRRVYNARHATISDDNAGQVPRGQLAPDSPVHAWRRTARSRSHA